jgi:NADP-dependent 3-hydroxy acid dehydrogenase YdfG
VHNKTLVVRASVDSVKQRHSAGVVVLAAEERPRLANDQVYKLNRGDMANGVAVVTGASSGIGAAAARQLAAAGFDVVLGARRMDRLEAVANDVGGRALHLDVTDTASVDAFCAQVPDCRLLVNNAGGALGRDAVERADEDEWRWMYDANVMGTMRMTRALLPALEASGDGHVVMVGSIAGHEAYAGGAGYNAVKFALRAVTKVLRLELVGRPVRVTSIDPGMVDTEFSVVRFHGDADKAAAVYDGMTPLTADDVADCIVFAVTRPSHVNIDTLVVMPRDQAAATVVHRSS